MFNENDGASRDHAMLYRTDIRSGGDSAYNPDADPFCRRWVPDQPAAPPSPVEGVQAAPDALEPEPLPRDKCAAWLADMLGKKGVVESNWAVAEAKQLGFSQRTFERARRALSVKPFAMKGKWYMRLPFAGDTATT